MVPPCGQSSGSLPFFSGSLFAGVKHGGFYFLSEVLLCPQVALLKTGPADVCYNTMAFLDNDPESFLTFHPYKPTKSTGNTKQNHMDTSKNQPHRAVHGLFHFERYVLKQLISLGREWNRLVTPDWKRYIDCQRELIQQAHQRSITKFRIQSEVVQEWKHKMGQFRLFPFHVFIWKPKMVFIWKPNMFYPLGYLMKEEEYHLNRTKNMCDLTPDRLRMNIEVQQAIREAEPKWKVQTALLERFVCELVMLFCFVALPMCSIRFAQDKKETASFFEAVDIRPPAVQSREKKNTQSVCLSFVPSVHSVCNQVLFCC